MIPKVAPPTVASGLNAHSNMSANVAGRFGAFITSTTMDPSTYSTAMIGTIFSVTAARRETPPRKMTPASTTTAIPMSHVGTPNALFMVSAMEFD